MSFFQEIVQKLAAANIDSPLLETREIFAFALHKQPAEIYSGCEVGETEKQQILKLVQQRLRHFPLDKIIGRKGFYKSEFITNESVLSPRPDTEILVEKALALLPPSSDAAVLDLGTGSGCIIESILQERPNLTGTAADISEQALQTARQNAENLEVSQRLSFIHADWFESDFLTHFPQKFAMIVTNPPYIPQDDIKNLEPEVKDHDPLLALSGGASGFDSYQKIAELAPFLLQDDGWILIEAGIGQARKIADIFSARSLVLKEIAADLAGIERCVILQKKVAQL